MSLKEKISYVNYLKNQMTQAHYDFDQKNKELEKLIKVEFEKLVKSLGDNIKWLPSAPDQVFVYTINGLKVTSNDKWVEHIYNEKMVVKINNHPVKYYKDRFDEFELETGLKVSFDVVELNNKQEIIEKGLSRWYDQDLFVLFNEYEIVEQGNISYLGWDCEDKYLIIKANDKYYVTYSTDAHGGNLQFVKNIGELNKFFNYIESEESDGKDYLRNVWYDLIVKTNKNDFGF